MGELTHIWGNMVIIGLCLRYAITTYKVVLVLLIMLLFHVLQSSWERERDVVTSPAGVKNFKKNKQINNEEKVRDKSCIRAITFLHQLFSELCYPFYAFCPKTKWSLIRGSIPFCRNSIKHTIWWVVRTYVHNIWLAFTILCRKVASWSLNFRSFLQPLVIKKVFFFSSLFF